jgi:predicted transcriptional regulator
MTKRTYELEDKVVKWIDSFADENGSDKSEVANRAIKVYAAKVQSEEWSDPKFADKIDRRFDRSDV